MAFNDIHSNISEYGGNPNDITIIGHSAGAHLSALVTTDASYLSKYSMTPNDIEKVILLDAGLYDLVTKYNQRDSKLQQAYDYFFNDLQNASPIYHIESNEVLPEFLILYASDNKEEGSPDQSKAFKDKLSTNGHTAEIKGYTDKKHEDMHADIGYPDDPLTIDILEFITN